MGKRTGYGGEDIDNSKQFARPQPQKKSRTFTRLSITEGDALIISPVSPITSLVIGIGITWVLEEGSSAGGSA